MTGRLSREGGKTLPKQFGTIKEGDGFTSTVNSGVFQVLATLPSLQGHKRQTISFASTLYLYPILELLLADVPPQWKPELRLGLQEALVNAAKHGNHLDPTKRVEVQFSQTGDRYWWIISDQGAGFTPPSQWVPSAFAQPCCRGECGRGLYILYQIFDEVRWSSGGRQLRLSKFLGKRGPISALK